MPEGISKLIDLMELDSSSTFCDLGSGIGRVVLHAAMLSHVKEAVGLELSDSRLEQVGGRASTHDTPCTIVCGLRGFTL